MGYMGFGMRKENYQRKAKKPFERVSSLYGDEKLKLKHDKDSPQLTREEVLNKPRFRGLGDFRWFSFLKIVVMIFLLFYALYHMFFFQWLYKKRAEWYQADLIENYGEPHRQLLKEVRNFKDINYISIQKNCCLKIEKNNGMQLKPYSQFNNPKVIKIGGYSPNAINFSLEGDHLKVLQKDSTVITLAEEWYLVYNADKIDSNYYSFLHKLKIDSSEIDEMRTLLTEVNAERVYYERGVSYLILSKKKDFKEYQFVYDPLQKLKHKYVKLMDEQTYFKKY